MKKYILIMLIILTSCKTSEDENEFTPTLPLITQTGENTFGCYIDGTLLTPRDGTGTLYGPDTAMFFISGPSPTNIYYYELIVHDFKSEFHNRIDIHFIDLIENEPQSFSVKNGNCQPGLDAYHSINFRCRFNGNWYCSINDSGVLSISKFNNQILSGTFSFEAQNTEEPYDIIEITDGIFDINRYTVDTIIYP
jgi:hypothetical protein